MKQDLNYPVKYAVLEMIDKNNREEETAFYMAAKCYVIDKEEVYLEKEHKEIYKVLFPIQDVLEYATNMYYSYRKSILDNPKMEDLSGSFYPVNVVDNLYDDYESAKLEAKNKNRMLKLNTISNIVWGKDWRTRCDQICQKHNIRLKTCERLEYMIAHSTKNMEVTHGGLTKVKRI